MGNGLSLHLKKHNPWELLLHVQVTISESILHFSGTCYNHMHSANASPFLYHIRLFQNDSNPPKISFYFKNTHVKNVAVQEF